MEGERRVRPSPLWQRMEVECLPCAGMGVEFSELRGGEGGCVGRRRRGAAAFLGLWVGIIVCLYLWLWILPLSAALSFALRGQIKIRIPLLPPPPHLAKIGCL